MSKKREEELVNQITDAVNNLSFDSELFCQMMEREHKTLQQNFMRDIIVPFIKRAASVDYSTDARNADTHILAVRLKAVLDEGYALPYV